MDRPRNKMSHQKKYTALRRYCLHQTQRRKDNLRRLTQEVKDMIKRKHKGLFGKY